MAQIIDGKQIAEQIKAEVHAGVSLLLKERQVRPGLGVILVGEDPASQSYVRSKGKACEDLGMYSETRRLPASATEAEVLSLVRAWNDDASIHGILVQLPLPRHINEHRVIAAIDPRRVPDHPREGPSAGSGQR